MANAISQPAGTLPDLNSLYAQVANDPNLTPTQQQQLNTAAQQLGLNPSASYSAPIPGAPDTGPATGGAGTKTVDLMTPETKKWLETGKTGGSIDSLSVADWLKGRAGDIALIVLALLVIAVALFATVQRKDLILKTVGKGVMG